MATKEVLFLQHGGADRPGLFRDVLRDRHIELTVVRPDLGQPVPRDLGRFRGLAIGGGSQGVYEVEKYPFLVEEMMLIRRTISEDRPVIGFCLGGQLMAASLGAEVRPTGSPEVGFFPVELNQVANLDPLWCGLERQVVAAHWHGDAFEVPVGGMVLASSEMTPNQLFRYGSGHYGFQFHLEMTEDILADLIERSTPALPLLDAERIYQEASRYLPATRETAWTVLDRWADFL